MLYLASWFIRCHSVVQGFRIRSCVPWQHSGWQLTAPGFTFHVFSACPMQTSSGSSGFLTSLEKHGSRWTGCDNYYSKWTCVNEGVCACVRCPMMDWLPIMSVFPPYSKFVQERLWILTRIKRTLYWRINRTTGPCRSYSKLFVHMFFFYPWKMELKFEAKEH